MPIPVYEECEKCGAQLEAFQEGASCGFHCNQCGWGVVTTYRPQIMSDPTIYHVYLKDGNPRNLEQIRVVSRISGQNYLNAKKLIQSVPVEIFAGKAVRVKEIVNQMMVIGVSVEVVPKFDW